MKAKAHAAGMLLQVMPDGTGTPDDFEHLEQLTDTVKNEELFSLEANDLLYRLYNQEKVPGIYPQPVEFFCGCSTRQRSGAAIITVLLKKRSTTSSALKVWLFTAITVAQTTRLTRTTLTHCTQKQADKGDNTVH